MKIDSPLEKGDSVKRVGLSGWPCQTGHDNP